MVNAGPGVVLSNDWVRVKIPLADFVGVNLGAIRQMVIGVGDRNAPALTGNSLVFIDNIRVVRPDDISP